MLTLTDSKDIVARLNSVHARGRLADTVLGVTLDVVEPFASEYLSSDDYRRLCLRVQATVDTATEAVLATIAASTQVQAIIALRPALAARAPRAVGPPPPTTTPAKRVIVKGSGSRNTKPFTMPGGDFTVVIAGSGNGNVIADLIPRGGTTFDGQNLFNEISHGKYKYDTSIYGVSAGSYYIDMTNSNAWVITFTPLP